MGARHFHQVHQERQMPTDSALLINHGTFVVRATSQSIERVSIPLMFHCLVSPPAHMFHRLCHVANSSLSLSRRASLASETSMHVQLRHHKIEKILMWTGGSDTLLAATGRRRPNHRWPNRGPSVARVSRIASVSAASNSLCQEGKFTVPHWNFQWFPRGNSH